MESYIITVIFYLILIELLDGDSPNFKFDKSNMSASFIPECKCLEPGKVRPNVLMFDDEDFNPKRSDV